MALSPETRVYEPASKPLLNECPRDNLLVLRILLLHPVVFVQTTLRLCNLSRAFIDIARSIQIVDNSLPVVALVSTNPHAVALDGTLTPKTDTLSH